MPARPEPLVRRPLRLPAGLSILAAAVAIGASPACGDGATAPRDAAAADVAGPGGDAPARGTDAGLPRPRFLDHLGSHADFERVQGEGGEVKYFAALAGRTAPAPLDRPCTFQDTERYPFHLDFLKSVPGLAGVDYDGYRAFALRRERRVAWAGTLKLVPGAIHPRTGAKGVIGYFLFTEPGDAEAPTADELVELDQRLKGCAPFAAGMLALIGGDPEQASRLAALAPTLGARGVDLVDWATLRPGVGAEGYSLGEGYGFLRVVPRGRRAQTYGPRDVLVVDSAPDDLGLVAGQVTVLPQNLHSHVNLRLREKMIPNASVRDIRDNRVVGLLDGKLVHLVVRETRVEIEPARPAAAEAFWAARRPKPVTPAADLNETRLRDLTAVGARDALAFGTKAANLAELQKVVPPAGRTPGFAIPFSVYRDFMAGNGLQARVEALLADPLIEEDAFHRRSSLAALRKAIEAAPLDPALLERLAQAARAAFGEGYQRAPTRFRSSSNVEDVGLWSGAGLHDSARGCFADDADGDDLGPSACLAADERAALEADLARRRADLQAHPDHDFLLEVIDDLENDLTRERSVARAVGKVFASLWNDRAFDERAYYRIDQRAVYMGVAVNPSFVMEKLDAVALTQLDAGAGGPLYRVVSQRGGETVVQPADPSLVAETLTFRRGPGDVPTDVQVLVSSSLSPTPLWSDVQLGGLAAQLFAAHDHFAAQVYPQINRLSLDIEIKITRDDRVVLKQARPYAQP